MNKDEGFKVLEDVIAEDKHHQDYDRVKNLAVKYYKMVTGEGIDSLLKRIIKRESDDEFKQRKEITKSVVPSILNSTKLPFQKATRKQPLVRKIDYDTEADNKKTELEDYINKYWGRKSLEKFLEYAYTDYNYLDPNAFLITEFNNFDPKVEKASPYPFIATSEEAIMFEIDNEILEYLIVKLPIEYIEKGAKQSGFKFTIYLGYDTIVMTQCASDFETDLEKIEIKKKFYTVEYFEPKNDKVPAIRFGYMRDNVTKGRTFISVFHPVLAYLEKTLKIDSELDLSTAMVAFPQRFAYVTPCKNPDCQNGYVLDGSECKICHGTGEQPLHRGAMDVVTLQIPHDATPADLLDLNNLLVYKSPPIDLLTFQQEYIEYLKKSVHAMMFNADLFTRSEVSVTATEKTLETDNMNDTLYPFARNYSAVWEFVVQDIAIFTDLNQGLEVQHKFPNDFKMKTIEELMNDLKQAKDAEASTSTVMAIEDDINEILYSDRPDELKKIRIKNQINPFRGYADADIRFIISQGNIPIFKRTLWENFESIFQDLEAENQNPWLYDLAIDKIIKLVTAKTDEYVKKIADEKPQQTQPVNFNA